jgi:hypothetical protein
MTTGEAEELAQQAIDLTTSIIDAYGPRLTTTDACTKAANVLYDGFKKSCDRAYFEDFVTQPNGPIPFLKWMSVFFYIALFLVWLNVPQVAFLAQSCSVAVLVFEFLLLGELVDRFAADAIAHNTYGVIEPQEEAKNCVIFSGHHDSAHIFNYIVEKPQLYFVRIGSFVVVILGFWVYLAWATWKKLITLSLFVASHRTGSTWFATILATIGAGAVIPMWFFVNEKGTPGAGDNLISSAMAAVLARHYRAAGRPKNTRLVFMSFDAEEICLRGSRAFFRRHKAEYTDVKTWNFNVDCPYWVDEIKFLLTDVNGFLSLSKRLAVKLTQIAHELGYTKAQTKRFMFCGGGTDAAEAAAAGIEATTLVAMPFSAKDSKGRRNVYHTPKDTIDAVEPETVRATIEIFMKFVDELEDERFP